jgi:hypothetical protein
MFNKWFGIGGHLAFSTIITGSTTEVESIGGKGIWGTITPLQSLGIDWLQFDVIYTHVVNTQIFDQDFDTLSKQITPRPATPPNIHNQLDISVRVIGNARNLISFFFSLGATQFHNEYGTDQYVLSKFPETASWIKGYQETEWGLGGSFGLQMNIKTPYALIQPIGEWRVAKILGARTLPKHTTSFFISQPRLGLLIYPDFSKLF